MKNLPERFPIRYAIIVSDWLDKDIEEDKPQFYTSTKSEMLFRQLLLLLQKEALSEELLIPTAETIKFTLMDVEIVNISKLNATSDWATNIESGVIKIIPEAKRSLRSAGVAFELGLYSYRGAGEKPSFLTAHNILVKHSNHIQQGLMEIINKFGHIENKYSVKYLYDNYEKIKDVRYPSVVYSRLLGYCKHYDYSQTGTPDTPPTRGSMV